jgi:hypothetical protein
VFLLSVSLCLSACVCEWEHFLVVRVFKLLSQHMHPTCLSWIWVFLCVCCQSVNYESKRDNKKFRRRICSTLSAASRMSFIAKFIRSFTLALSQHMHMVCLLSVFACESMCMSFARECVCVCLLSVCVCVSECVCASHAHSSCIRYGRCPCTECEFVCVCCLFVWVCVCLLSVYCVHFCQCVCRAQLCDRLPWPEISDTPRIRNYNGDVWNIYQLDIYISCGKH